MASENETVAKVLDDFAYLITIGDIGSNIATDIKSRIESAHRREIDELTFKLMTAKSEQKTAANVLIEQTNKVERLSSEVAGLRECLEDACKCMCLDCDVEDANGYTRCGYECRVKRWRNALEGGAKC